jgi:hypothetical protein
VSLCFVFNPLTGNLDLINKSTGSGSGAWGDITGALSNQQDLTQELASLVDGSVSYYFTSVASNFGGARLDMTRGIPPGGGAEVTKVSATTGSLIAEYASISGVPAVTYVPSGGAAFYVTARKSAGTKEAKLYAEFYHRTTLGVSTLIATSNLTTAVTGSNSVLKAYATIPFTTIAATDRITVAIKASVSGIGTDPTIVMRTQGLSRSRCHIPFEPLVTSVSGKIGDVTLTKSDVGLANVDNTSDINKPISTATQTALDLKQDEISPANTNAFIYKTNAGLIEGHPNLSRDNTFGGTFQNLTPKPNNLSGTSLNSSNINIEPLANSANESYSLHQSSINLDNNSSGFDFGTSGRAAGVLNNTIGHLGTGNTGSIDFMSNYFNLGNGVDAIDVKGFTYNHGFGNVNANVNISGAMQGYGYQPVIDASATLDLVNSYTNAFYDGAVIGCASSFYTSFSSNPQIESIANDKNFSAMNINPNITTLTGSAGAIGIGVFGTYGTFGTGNFTGVQVSPNITSGNNATGLQVDMTNVTASGVIRAADFNGDVNINGSLSFNGDLSAGQLNAFYASNPIDGGGNPQQMHGLTTSMVALDSVTVANVDAIGVNNAMLITLEDNSVCTSGAFKLGFAAVALPCVVSTGVGSTLDFMNMAVYALNLSTSTGGTIDRVNGARVEAIPNGVTTINEFVAFEFNQSFGQVGTDVWGLHCVPTFAENFIGGSLNIGSSTRKVTNSSIAFEIGSQKSFVNARMDTTTRDALTAIDGMQIYNTTTNKLQIRASSSWVDMH